MSRAEKQPLLSCSERPASGAGPPTRNKHHDRLHRLLAEIKKDGKLVGFLALMIFFGLLNRVTFKLMLDSMKNYPFFLNQLTSFIYLPIFFSYCYYMMYIGRFPMEQTNFPKRRFLVMGTLDCVQGICVTFAGSAVALSLQPLLGQGIIPTTMLMSYIFLRVRFRLLQYAGALTIFGGIVVSLYPALSAPAKAAAGTASGAAALFYQVLFFSGNLPSALSTVYKEIVFKEDDIDVMYMNAYVALFQFLLGVLAAPLAVAMDQTGTLTMAGIPRHLWQGTLCFLLERNSLPGDDCGANLGARASASLYMAVNIIYNIALLYVLKYSSATLLYVASTVILPLVSVVSSSRRVMGSSARPLTAFDLAGLLLILAGLGMYRSVRERVAEGKEEEAAAGDSSDEEEAEKQAVRHEVSFTTSALALAPFGRLPPPPRIRPRTIHDIRHAYLRRLGMTASPPSSSPPHPAPPPGP